MTTVAYHHKDKQIAVDSRMTYCGVVETDCYDKTRVVGSRRYIFEGQVEDIERFIEEHGGVATDAELGCRAVMIENGKAYDVFKEKGVFKQAIIDYNYAMGSGWKFAVAAMDHGKTAKEAVQYAAKRDIYTGGRIHVYKL